MLQEWLFKEGCYRVGVGSLTLAHNVLQIAEGGDFEAETFNKEQMMIQGTNFNFSTTPPLLAMCCYTLFFPLCT